MNESSLWEKLNNARNNQPDAKWLREVYSPNLSYELRMAIAEKLGLLDESGWLTLLSLYKQFGAQPEFIHAAGFCHQPEAREWLLSLLKEQKEFELLILQALGCWGASLPTSMIKDILKKPELEKRLAGITLLSFKAHQLSDKELLELTEELVDDFREPIVIATIKILQRREGVDICKIIAKIVQQGTDSTAQSAIMALGSMGTVTSHQMLSKLNGTLAEGERLKLVKKQIIHQYRFSKR